PVEPRDLPGGLDDVGVRDLQGDDPVQPNVARAPNRPETADADSAKELKLAEGPRFVVPTKGGARTGARPRRPRAMTPVVSDSGVAEIRRQLGLQPRSVQLGKPVSILGDIRRFSPAPPVLDIQEHELAEEEPATRAGRALEKPFDLRPARRLPGRLETV